MNSPSAGIHVATEFGPDDPGEGFAEEAFEEEPERQVGAGGEPCSTRTRPVDGDSRSAALEAGSQADGGERIHDDPSIEGGVELGHAWVESL